MATTVDPKSCRVPIADVEPGLTMDEYLRAFIERWEMARAGLMKKHKERAEHFRHRYGMNLCYESEMRSFRHYEHEAAMLAELRKRALDI